MTDSIYFGIFLSIFMFYIGIIIFEKLKHPIFHPLLIGVILTISILKIFDISYEEFMNGGKYIHFMLAPVTVLLVVPLYKNIYLLKKNLLPVLGGILVGSLISLISVFILAKVLGLNKEVFISLLPKSVTAGIGMPLASEFGGVSSIAAFAIIFTGILGAMTGDILSKILKINDPVEYGVMLGTAAHAMGTSKAMQKGEKEGAIAGLCICVCGIITVIFFPLVISLV